MRVRIDFRYKAIIRRAPAAVVALAKRIVILIVCSDELE